MPRRQSVREHEVGERRAGRQASTRSALLPDRLRAGDAEVRAVILINLLPHREARRQQRKNAFFAGIGFPIVCGAAIVGLWWTLVNAQINTQEDHNQFLSNEIKRLAARLADVARLRAELEALKARQKAVEDLQADRNMP